MDMRVVKTRRAIRNALIELAEEKDVDKITVKELCERAEISKPAFYSHYGNIYDVIDEVENEVVQRVCDQMAHRSIDDIALPAMLRELGEQVYQNPLRNVVRHDAESGVLGRKFITAFIEQRQITMHEIGKRRDFLAIAFAFDGLMSIMQRMSQEQFERSVDDLSVVMRAAITAFED